jgi:CheY-like chemotaxis protein
MNILIAEDTPEKLNQIETLLIEDMGFEKSNITITENKESTIEILEKNVFDFIILDMSLPKYKSEDSNIKHLAGKDILIYLRHKRKNIPTVVLTAHDVFGHHDSQISLNKLTLDLNNRFKKFLKGVFAWDASSDAWKSKIKKTIEDL